MGIMGMEDPARGETRSVVEVWYTVIPTVPYGIDRHLPDTMPSLHAQA